MELQQTIEKSTSRGSPRDYLELLKPRETGLLVFIGLAAAVVAGQGSLELSRISIIFAALLAASAGANGMTNYLDRSIDARMERTRRRVLPSKRILPAERALFFTVFLSSLGLALGWYLHPLVFLADLIGTASALIYRKRVTCVFPQGAIASIAPILMGWFSISVSARWELLFLCVLIAIWLPSHIWSIMIANKEDYIRAGITYFPLNRNSRPVSIILFIFCLFLYASSIGLYFFGGFGWLYLAVAIALGILITYASLRMVISDVSSDSWRLYKLSAFPYLGVLFLAIWLDIWLKV